jgi:hypothetical protein
MQFHRYIAMAVLIAAVGSANRAQAQAVSAYYQPKMDALTNQYNVQTFSPEAFSCKSPAAVAAIAIQQAKLDELKSVYANLFQESRGHERLRRAVGSTAGSLPIPSFTEDNITLVALAYVENKLLDNLYAIKNLPPCPTGYRTVFVNGLFVGIYVIKAIGSDAVTERFIATDQVTNYFSDTHDPLGIGINIGYAFAPFNNNVVVSPFVSVDYLNNSVNHNFPGGSFLGTTANVAGTAGVKIGPSLSKDFWLYGIAGVSVLNETLNINFLPVMSSTSKTVAGVTVGTGAAFRPSFLQNFGHPVSLFLEYQHTWWHDAQFNSPAASPPFNYNFHREDDLVKLGFNIHFNEPSTPSSPTYPVKAPMLK